MPLLRRWRNTGDTSASIGVFFDSFSKIAISVSVLVGLIGLDSNIIYQKIMPGTCSALFLLNFFYYWQAKRLTQTTGIATTAIPSGLQASCVFVWLFAIMLPIVLKTHDPLLAYHVALVANLINAGIYIISGVLLCRFKHLIPKPALFGALAGTAFTWLSVNNMGIVFNHPISGVLPLFLMLLLFFGNIKTKISPLLLGIVLGCALAYFSHDEVVHRSLNGVASLILPNFYIDGMFNYRVISYVWEYLPIIIAFSLIDAISAVQILEEVALSGEKPNPYSSILISGAISGASAFFGNPFAMALFYGHATWKKALATANYSLWVGCIFLVIGCFGLVNIVIDYIPDWVTISVLIFIGISTTSICFANLEKEYYPILVIAMIPILIEMMFNKLELLAVAAHIKNIRSLLDSDGMLIIAKGSVLFSISFASLLYYVSIRRWLLATTTCMVMLLLSVGGFIHAETPGLHFNQPMNIVYVTMSLFCLIVYFTSKYGIFKIK